MAEDAPRDTHPVLVLIEEETRALKVIDKQIEILRASIEASKRAIRELVLEKERVEYVLRMADLIRDQLEGRR